MAVTPQLFWLRCTSPQAIIEFDLSGNILNANANFCTALGYELPEIKGKHHRIFVEPAEANSVEYREFWARLGRGEFDRQQYKRFTKSGREIWIEASYNPVLRGGKPYKVVKFATDITVVRQKAMEDAGKLNAVSRSQAVIEFTPTGEILTANENFCGALGLPAAGNSGAASPDVLRSRLCADGGIPAVLGAARTW